MAQSVFKYPWKLADYPLQYWYWVCGIGVHVVARLTCLRDSPATESTENQDSSGHLCAIPLVFTPTRIICGADLATSRHFYSAKCPWWIYHLVSFGLWCWAISICKEFRFERFIVCVSLVVSKCFSISKLRCSCNVFDTGSKQSTCVENCRFFQLWLIYCGAK